MSGGIVPGDDPRATGVGAGQPTPPDRPSAGASDAGAPTPPDRPSASGVGAGQPTPPDGASATESGAGQPIPRTSEPGADPLAAGRAAAGETRPAYPGAPRITKPRDPRMIDLSDRAASPADPRRLEREAEQEPAVAHSAEPGVDRETPVVRTADPGVEPASVPATDYAWAPAVPAAPRPLAGIALWLAIAGLGMSLVVGWAFAVGAGAILVGIVALRRPGDRRGTAVWAIGLAALSLVYSAAWLAWAASRL